MSQWTHVNAVIRFDGMKDMMPDPDLGSTVSFDDEQDTWDRCNVPCGSEGSLSYHLEEVGEGMTRFTAAIWGDLRNYSDTEEIITYFKRITEGQMIRSGLVEIDVEYGDTIVMQHQRREEDVTGEWVILDGASSVLPTEQP